MGFNSAFKGLNMAELQMKVAHVLDEFPRRKMKKHVAKFVK
jgi:hypothetical protein